MFPVNHINQILIAQWSWLVSTQLYDAMFKWPISRTLPPKTPLLPIFMSAAGGFNPRSYAETAWFHPRSIQGGPDTGHWNIT